VKNNFTGMKGKITVDSLMIAENAKHLWPVSRQRRKAPCEGDDLVRFGGSSFADGTLRAGHRHLCFTEMSGEALANHRIRLAKTQNVIQYAKMKATVRSSMDQASRSRVNQSAAAAVRQDRIYEHGIQNTHQVPKSASAGEVTHHQTLISHETDIRPAQGQGWHPIPRRIINKFTVYLRRGTCV